VRAVARGSGRRSRQRLRRGFGRVPEIAFHDRTSRRRGGTNGSSSMTGSTTSISPEAWTRVTNRGVAIVSIVTMLASLTVAIVATTQRAAEASTTPHVPGVPGTPVATGMPRAAAVHWNAPSDPGSPALSRYRVEVDDGSGWSNVTTQSRGDAVTTGANF